MRIPTVLFLAALTACSDPAEAPDAGTGPSPEPLDLMSPHEALEADAPDCATPPPCASSDGDHFSLCGRIVDIVDDGGIPDTSVLEVTLYDAVRFVNPNREPLAVDWITIDNCGRYRAEHVELPPSEFVVAFVDDPGDAYVGSGTIIAVSPGWRANDVALRAVPTATDAAWSAQAQLADDTTFSEIGAWLPIFLAGDEPASGVQITVNGEVADDGAVYFSDPDAARTTIDPGAIETGPNGTGLLTSSSLVPHSGTGGLPEGCSWISVLSTTVPGSILFHEIRVEDEGCL